MYNFFCLFLFCLFPFKLFAQAFPVERIFMALDKESYALGDTLRVNGQILSADHPGQNAGSRYIYIECINSEDSLWSRIKIRCDDNGYFQTDIPTQFDWNSGLCYLRAYTRQMQNYTPEHFPVLPFVLGLPYPKRQPIAKEVTIKYFPESGCLLEGYQQNVVFQLSDDDRFPIIPTQTRLLDADNDTLLHRIDVSPNGWGRFAFIPQPGKQYQLQVEYDGRFFNQSIKSQSQGTALQVALNPRRLTCRILATEVKPLRLYLYQAESGLTEIRLQTGQEAIVLDMTRQPQGGYTLFLTDTEGHLLNERTVWKKAEKMPIPFGQLPSQATAGAILPVSIQAPDSSHLFSRIVSADNLFAQQAVSALLLGNEIGSPIRMPWIDERQTNQQQTEIDNWLFTARFHLFDIQEVLKNGINHPFLTEDVMLLQGTAWAKEDIPMREGTIIDAENRKDQLFYSTTTNKKGEFIIPVEDFTEGTIFWLSAKDPKGKEKEGSFTLVQESYPKVVIPYPPFQTEQLQAQVQTDGQSFAYSMDENQEKVYHIDNITVETRKRVNIHETKRTPLNFIGEQELQQRGGLSVRSILSRFPAITVKYKTGGGGAGELGAIYKEIRFRNEDKLRSSKELIQESGELAICWKNNRDGRLKSKDANNTLTVVVDGEIAFGDIGTILDQPAGSLQSIEIVKPSDSRCVPYNATGGLVLIKTRQGFTADITDKVKVKPFGLSNISTQHMLPPKVPHKPGNYLLLVDLITPEKQVYSFIQPFSVK